MKPEDVENLNLLLDPVMGSAEQLTKKQVVRNLEQCRTFRGPWRGRRESNGWFIDVPQMYYLGRKEEGRKRPGLKSHTSGALF